MNDRQDSLQILALEPYGGGSHLAFLDGWRAHSRHEFTVMTLPAYKWKWRMRHSALTFVEQVSTERMRNRCWDVLFCSSMLPLAEFLALCPKTMQRLPSICYFHENQLTYPNQSSNERDLHFAFSNFVSAHTANEVWFNSEFHRNEFLGATRLYLERMPDYQPIKQLDSLTWKTRIQSPGINAHSNKPARRPGPLRVVWVGRWEHDKNPRQFFDALQHLTSQIEFELIVLGESFEKIPDEFVNVRDDLRDRVIHWGYVDSVDEYRNWLVSSDIVVSTAIHEYFGIALLEAVSLGCIPVIPDRLAYPETIALDAPLRTKCFYDGSTEALCEKILDWHSALIDGDDATPWIDQLRDSISRYHWVERANAMDNAVTALFETQRLQVDHQH